MSTHTEGIHHSYLHELAEARRQPATDRRRAGEWAEVRAEIDFMMELLQPRTEHERLVILRAYKIGFARGGAMMPRQQTTLVKER